MEYLNYKTTSRRADMLVALECFVRQRTLSLFDMKLTWNRRTQR